MGEGRSTVTHVQCLLYMCINWVIVLHLGLEGCSQPRESWFSDILMYHSLVIIHINCVKMFHGEKFLLI